MSKASGHCWVLGQEALHVSAYDGSFDRPWYPSKSVFYDAIGHVGIDTVGGLEQVVVSSRDGGLITALVVEGDGQFKHASDVVDRLRKAATSARRTSAAVEKPAV